jgi:hypothetical protein
VVIGEVYAARTMTAAIGRRALDAWLATTLSSNSG